MKPESSRHSEARATRDRPGLIDRARAGDPRAERALYDAHVDRLFRLAFRLTGDEELATEYTQQAFTRAFRSLHTFRGDASFSTWLHRVTVNVTLSGLRKDRRRREVEQELETVAPPAAPPARPSDPMLRQRIEDALESLPGLYREAVVLHDIRGYTHDEISSMLAIPSGTSKARLSRARARLRPLLAGCALEYAT
jgi:RNA polymerase sigma-70 factor, ECF subfamily